MKYILKGLGCANCAAKMEEKINKLNEIKSASINFTTKTLTLELKEDVKENNVISKIDDIVKSIEPDVKLLEISKELKEQDNDNGDDDDEEEDEEKIALAKIIISGILCLLGIFLNVNDGKTSPIEVKDIDEASNPSGDDLSQSIDKSDYLSIANRVHSWMDSQGSVPNYVGISQAGVADLSPDKMLKLFTLASLDYAVTGDLPSSVEI